MNAADFTGWPATTLMEGAVLVLFWLALATMRRRAAATWLRTWWRVLFAVMLGLGAAASAPVKWRIPVPVFHPGFETQVTIPSLHEMPFGASRACFRATVETGCRADSPARRPPSDSLAGFMGGWGRAAAVARGVERVARAPLDSGSRTNQRPGMAGRSRARDARQRVQANHSATRASRRPRALCRGLFPATDCAARRSGAMRGCRAAAAVLHHEVRAPAQLVTWPGSGWPRWSPSSTGQTHFSGWPAAGFCSRRRWPWMMPCWPAGSRAWITRRCSRKWRVKAARFPENPPWFPWPTNRISVGVSPACSTQISGAARFPWRRASRWPSPGWRVCWCNLRP